MLMMLGYSFHLEALIGGWCFLGAYVLTGVAGWGLTLLTNKQKFFLPRGPRVFLS